MLVESCITNTKISLTNSNTTNTTMLTNTYLKILIEARIINPYFQTILYRLDTINVIVFLLI